MNITTIPDMEIDPVFTALKVPREFRKLLKNFSFASFLNYVPHSQPLM